MNICSHIIDLIFPDFCDICNSKLRGKERIICGSCLLKIRVNTPPFCAICARPLAYERKRCSECEGTSSLLKQVWAWGIYQDMLKECIHIFKYGREAYIPYLFKNRLIEFSCKNGVMRYPEIITPVPLYKSKLRYRTFNQSFIIAQILAQFHRKPLKNILNKTKKTVPQHGLSRLERIRNVQDTYRLSDKTSIDGKIVLLVDDIFTTGATLNECARVLLNAGAQDVYGFTLARGI